MILTKEVKLSKLGALTLGSKYGGKIAFVSYGDSYPGEQHVNITIYDDVQDS